jgi:hypothetical protein
MPFLRFAFAVAVVFSTPVVGRGDDASATALEVPSGIDHSPWGRLLAEYVDENGRVAYARLAASTSDRDALRAYVAQFARAGKPPAGGAERIASLINAYNAFTISWILENYPTSSIRSTREPFKGRRYDIGGKKVSVDDIEHAALRPTAGFRVHSAISCASRSCPPLSREAYEAATLDQSLDAGMRRWLAREELNRFLPSRKKAEVSKVFKWFKEDFEKSGGLKPMLARYAPQRYQEFLSKGDYEVDYLDYDWTLNDQAPVKERGFWDRLRGGS